MLPSFDRVGGTVMGQRVHFRRLADEERKLNNGDLSPWVYMGRVDGRGLELWTESGRWRENESAHPLDLALVAGN